MLDQFMVSSWTDLSFKRTHILQSYKGQSSVNAQAQ